MTQPQCLCLIVIFVNVKCMIATSVQPDAGSSHLANVLLDSVSPPDFACLRDRQCAAYLTGHVRVCV